MAESLESLRRLFSDAGYGFVEPPIVHAASAFVELAGEDLRRRMLLTSGADGAELALRPDYTIPVCLMHLAAGDARRKASYAYLGPVFRQRPDEPAEFLQAGIESFGRTDRVAADADVLKLALAAVDLLGVKRPAIRTGDSALFAAVLDTLDLNPPWRRRLRRAFGDTPRLRAMIESAAGKGGRAAEGLDKAAVAKRVGALFAETGLATVGGRSAAEIVDRAVEKAALAAGIGSRAAKVLAEFLAVAGTPVDARKALAALAKRHKLAVGKAIDRFARRNDAFAARGIDLDRLAFAADFGRRLDYYTGFVFEVHDRKRGGARQIVGGGRYDRLLSLLAGANREAGATSVPAVGFAVWLDRIEAVQ
jgi:ATP phosphoribosyltransferase regulatory subunit